MTDKNMNKPADIVYLYGLKCETTVGVWEWEKNIKQIITLDIDLACDIKPAAEQDDLTKALDYQAIAERVKTITESNQFELIESLAEKVANTILSEFSTNWIKIKLDKGQAVPGVKNVGVVIERSAES